MDTTASFRSRGGRWLLVGLILLAFALRTYRLGYQSLTGDEAVSVLYSERGWQTILASTTSYEPHPPLYHVSLHFWVQALGRSEFAVRFFSLLFSLVAVPLIYRLGLGLLRAEVGLLGALITAINPFQVWYAQDARMYPLSLALSLGSVL